MSLEIKIPSPGESISEVTLAAWLVADNSWVEKDQEIAEVESDKATLPLLAEEAGIVSFKAAEGDSLQVGDVACTIDTKAEKPASAGKKEEESRAAKTEKEEAKQDKAAAKKEAAKPAEKKAANEPVKVTPVAEKMMQENGLDIEAVLSGLKRLGKKEVEAVLQSGMLANQPISRPEEQREAERTSMSPLRKKLSQKLVSVKNETAMLTTFNEVDMSEVIRIRKSYQEEFKEKHGVKLGFMSFFTRAVTEALKLYPNVNSMIEGEEIVHFRYSDIGIAVQTPKGLMVPVIRNADILSLADIEHRVLDLATRGRKNRLTIDELSGGTFTITNGGVFGSMLSTPIINPPQAGILGMHNIVERPVAVNGRVEIRPIMYLALSYDHRLIDGKDSVSFLVSVKNFIENPLQMLTGGEPERALLNL